MILNNVIFTIKSMKDLKDFLANRFVAFLHVFHDDQDKVLIINITHRHGQQALNRQ